MSRVAFLPLCALASGCLAAPVSGTITSITVTNTYSTLVAAPGSAGVTGTPLGHRRVGLEFAVAHDATNTGRRARGDGGLAHQVVGTRGAVRAVFGLTGYFEVGPSLEWSFGDATPVAPDNTSVPRGTWIRGALLARVHFVRRRPWTLGLDFDVLVSQVPYRTGRSTTTTMTPYGPCDRWFTPGSSSCPLDHDRATTTERGTFVDDAVVRADLRFGPFAGGRIGSRTWVLGGLTLQTHPRYAGTAINTTSCDSRATTPCDSPSRWDAPTSRAEMAGTLWVGLGVDLGALSLFARFHGNVFGAADVTHRSPFGFLASTRFNVSL